jgi:hypothetical protein
MAQTEHALMVPPWAVGGSRFSFGFVNRVNFGHPPTLHGKKYWRFHWHFMPIQGTTPMHRSSRASRAAAGDSLFFRKIEWKNKNKKKASFILRPSV